MFYRAVTAAAILITGLIIYLLNLNERSWIYLAPLLILAIFQMSENKLRKIKNVVVVKMKSKTGARS